MWPCKSLGPILERLADEYAGAFVLAKVDSDAEQTLVAGMGVRSLPTVVLFKDGQPVDHFMGALSEGEIRAMLDKHVERVEASPLERAAELVERGQYEEAIALYQLITADDPENYDAYLDMAQALLMKGDSASAEAIVDRLPDTKKWILERNRFGRKGLSRSTQWSPDRATCESRLSSNDADSEARYFFAVHLMVSDDVETAIEHLLTIVRTDREYNEDAARLLLIQIFDRLGNEDSRLGQVASSWLQY